MNEDYITYIEGPRFIDGINIDADIDAAHPTVIYRDVVDPVNDGSLGSPSYAPGSTNKDGSPF